MTTVAFSMAGPKDTGSEWCSGLTVQFLCAISFISTYYLPTRSVAASEAALIGYGERCLIVVPDAQNEVPAPAEMLANRGFFL